MRRGAVFVIFGILMLSLSSCVSISYKAEESAQDIRTLIINSEMKLTAEVTADYGDRVYEFTLNYDTGTGLIEVKEPETLAGLTVTVSKEDGSTVLSYDGAELNTGTFDDDGLSPVSSLPILVTQWREGYILECYYETLDGIDTVAIKTNISDDVMSISWFDRANGNPIKSEIVTDEQVVIQCIFDGGNKE